MSLVARVIGRGPGQSAGEYRMIDTAAHATIGRRSQD